MRTGRLAGLVAVLALAAGPASAVLTDGLEHYWNFDDGPADYDDKVGSLDMMEKGGSDLAEIEAVETGAWMGRSAYSTSDSAWLRTESATGDMNITDEVTISYWLKMDDNGTGAGVRRHYGMRISGDPDNSFGEFNNFSAYQRMNFNPTNHLWYAWFFGNDGGSSIQGGTEGINWLMPEDTWVHRAITIASDGTLTDYVTSIDETDVTARSNTETPWGDYQGLDTTAFASKYLTMLSGQNNPGNWLDDVRIWSRALTAAEVQEVFDIPEPATLGLLTLGLLALGRRR